MICSICRDSLPHICDAPSPKDLMFFDIETTGLSPDSSFLYLIGCLYLDGDEVVHTQFFSEGISDEPRLIEAYDALLASHRILAHFNGQTFDLPYIARKRVRLGLTAPCDTVASDVLSDAPCTGHTVLSFDIFRYLRSYKKFLGMTSMSQKSLEVFCGLNREDIYDGGQLIDVYGRYIATKKLEELHSKSAPLSLPAGSDSASLLSVLLLHNYEDVLGMLEVCRMLALPAFIGKCTINPDIVCCNCDDCLQLTVKADYDMFMLKRRTIVCPDGSEIILNAEADSVTLSIPVAENEFRFFHADYRNYYYLPAEDSAIPRSIGEFMDKSLRVKCTPANCYTRHYLRVVPLVLKPSKSDCYPFRIFKTEFKSTAQYADIGQLEEDREMLREYVRSIFRGI